MRRWLVWGPSSAAQHCAQNCAWWYCSLRQSVEDRRSFWFILLNCVPDLPSFVVAATQKLRAVQNSFKTMVANLRFSRSFWAAVDTTECTKSGRESGADKDALHTVGLTNENVPHRFVTLDEAKMGNLWKYRWTEGCEVIAILME